MEKEQLKQYILCALFIAFSAICAQLIIPIQPVPITLGTLSILMAGALLGPKYGTLSILLYVLLGLAGAPVFSMMHGGVSVVMGPSGGFIMGWPLVALTVGGFARLFGPSYIGTAAAMTLGTAVCYVTGVTWFIILTGTGLWAAIVACVLPFLIGDVLKIAAGTVLVKKCRAYL